MWRSLEFKVLSRGRLGLRQRFGNEWVEGFRGSGVRRVRESERSGVAT